MNKKAKNSVQKNSLPAYLQYIILGLAVAIVLLIRIRLLSAPLERDEGGFAYMAQQFLKGHIPYSTALDSKPPGLYILIAIFIGIFGSTATGFHISLLVASIVSMFFIFLAGKKISGNWMGVCASVLYGFLSLNLTTLGFAAHATHFVVLFSVAGLYFLLDALEKDSKIKLLVAGFLTGIAFLMKQPGIVFIPMGICIIVSEHIFRKSIGKSFIPLALFTIASALPFLLVALWFKAAGGYDAFYKMVFGVTSTYAAKQSFSDGLRDFSNTYPAVIKDFWLVWLLALAGFVFSFFTNDNKTKTLLVFITVFGFLSTTPGLYFREHYFVSMLPAVALCAGFFASYIFTYISKTNNEMFGFAAMILMLFIPLVYGINAQKKYLFTQKPEQTIREIYQGNPFAEAPEIAKYIKEHSKPTEKIAILGSEPEIYFYSEREAATKYIFTYGMMDSTAEHMQMISEMETEIEKNKPVFLVLVKVPSSWIIGVSNTTAILRWATGQIEKYYNIVGVAEYVSPYEVNVAWDADAVNYKPQTNFQTLIFKRK